MATNLFDNLLVFIIILTICIVFYYKATGKSIGDLIRDIKEAITPDEVIE